MCKPVRRQYFCSINSYGVRNQYLLSLGIMYIQRIDPIGQLFQDGLVLMEVYVSLFNPEVFVYYLDRNFILKLDIKCIYLLFNFWELYTY